MIKVMITITIVNKQSSRIIITSQQTPNSAEPPLS